jgi:hypothetical protein
MILAGKISSFASGDSSSLDVVISPTLIIDTIPHFLAELGSCKSVRVQRSNATILLTGGTSLRAVPLCSNMNVGFTAPSSKMVLAIDHY